MTDLFFPSEAPSATEMRLILSTRYYPIESPRDDFFDIRVYGREVGATTGENITLPKYYWDHLRRFLWRHDLYMHLYDEAFTGVRLPPNLRSLIKRYIQYMDAVAEGLLTTAGNRKGDVNYRSYLFNMYLVVDSLVGRHEYDVVSRWAMEHPDIILECTNIDDIGECHVLRNGYDMLNLVPLQTGKTFMRPRIALIPSGQGLSTRSALPR